MARSLAIRAYAMMYSLVQTAKANGINPFEHLRSQLHGGQSPDFFSSRHMRMVGVLLSVFLCHFAAAWIFSSGVPKRSKSSSILASTLRGWDPVRYCERTILGLARQTVRMALRLA